MRRLSLLFAAAVCLVVSYFTSSYFNSKLSVSYHQRSLQRYITAQQRDAQKVVSDTALMRKLVQHTESPEEFNELAGKKYGLFLYAETIGDKEDLLFWNSQKILQPSDINFGDTSSIFFGQYLNGFYAVQKTPLSLSGMTANIVAYALIPVVYQYYLETENSQTQFAHNKDAIRKIAVTKLPTDFPIYTLDGKVLFYVQPVVASGQYRIDPVTIVLRITALVFLLILFHLSADKVVRKRGAITGLIYLALAIALVRALFYVLPETFSLRQFPLFDPTLYASNWFNRSLGDLLINSILLCWIMLFAWTHIGPIQKLPTFLKKIWLVLAGVLAIFVLVYATFELAGVVNKLVVNSKISFEVTDFSQLTVYTGISFFILALLSLSYYYFSRLLFRFILSAFPNLLYLYFTVAAAGLFFLTFKKDYTDVLFQLPILIWLVFYTLFLTQEQFIVNRFRVTIASVLFWIFTFSVSLAALIMLGNRQREETERKHIANMYEELTEPTKQSVILIALKSLDPLFLKNNFRRFFAEPENTRLRASITQTGMADYSSVYNTNIYVFDSAGHEVKNPDSKSYAELNNIFTAHGKPTRDTDLVYYETSPSQFLYLARKVVYDSTNFLGTLFMVASPKQFQEKQTFDPDLFRRGKKEIIDRANIFAIYKDRKLTQYTGSYPFPLELDKKKIPSNVFSNIKNGDYDELWFKASNQKIIIVARKKESVIESITLFSYLFCAFLFMVGVIRLFELGARISRTWPSVDVFSRMNIRTQIHVTIIFISILSFIIIGVATITYFFKRYDRNNREALSRASVGTIAELNKRIKDDGLVLHPDNFPDTATNSSLSKTVAEISDAHNVIVNIYDLNGTLQITSDDRIYKKGVLSTKMDPTAFYHLATLKEVQKIQNETVNDISYLSIYTAIQDSSGEKYGYLNIPSFTSQIELNQEISNFLITIINLNAFIVLIAGVIALFISTRITRSFSVIGDKMKAITLGVVNEEIKWDKDDEIGELVTQYNKMVHQLEESASALAKSEREGAWREMARQVAHEIKNPLTPMKLSIQYLQKAIQANQPNVKELTTNVAGTLIEQIDHLSKIASDFSHFANIGNKRLETIDLHNVIRSLLDLYSANPKVRLEWFPVHQEINMRVDKTHMNRLFTNLLSNAVDACSEREKCAVTISEKIEDDSIIVAVHDNGDGIPEEMKSKIFTPNFTTKTSGTGLGLAMCKGIVEQAGGHIWFQTKEGEGTTFFVQLPLVS